MEKLLQKLEKKLKSLFNKFLAKYLPNVDVGNAANDSPTASDHDQIDFKLLEFCWGGFKGQNAELDPNALIQNLCVKPASSKMTYGWLNKLDGLWGMERTEAKALACLFVPDGNKWVGGKFDWISVSRTSRDLKNIKEGYGGWSWNKFSSAQKFAFVIVSGDGKKRTNIVVG